MGPIFGVKIVDRRDEIRIDFDLFLALFAGPTDTYGVP